MAKKPQAMMIHSAVMGLKPRFGGRAGLRPPLNRTATPADRMWRGYSQERRGGATAAEFAAGAPRDVAGHRSKRGRAPRAAGVKSHDHAEKESSPSVQKSLALEHGCS